MPLRPLPCVLALLLCLFVTHAFLLPTALHPRSRMVVELSVLTPTPQGGGVKTTARVQRIRDISFQKEVLKDLTAAEFALQVEVKKEESTIDYEMVKSRLDKSLELLVQRTDASKSDNVNNFFVERIKKTRDMLSARIKVQHDNGERSSIGSSSSSSGGGGGVGSKDSPFASLLNSNNKGKSSSPPPSTTATGAAISTTGEMPPKSVKELQERVEESLRVIVREDGTVDWDGALETGKEVAKFGAELWERLNGKEVEEGLPSLSEIFGQAQAKAPETEEVLRLRAVVSEAKSNLDAVLKSRDDLRSDLRANRTKGLDIPQENVQILKRLDVNVKELEKRLRLFTLDLDMERICVYLQQELESSIEPLDQKVFIAEAALLDKQLSSLVAGLQLDKSNNNNNAASGGILTFANIEDKMADLTLVDEDELSLICGEVNDLKSRLGLDTQLVQMDWGSLGVVVSEGLAKVKTGLSFYGEGTKLLISDVQYAWALLLKAISGTTLKPREVNTVRRTGKDLLTLIPFTIILIIPLSPVGHVLVFSFIQRFFPEFYPSCYTDKRMNLRRLYSEIERKSDNDIIGDVDLVQWSFGGISEALSGDWVENIKRIFVTGSLPSNSSSNSSSKISSSTEQQEREKNSTQQ